VATVAKPEIVEAAWLPVWFALLSKKASLELAVAPGVIPSSFVLSLEAFHQLAMDWKTRAGVQARLSVDVPWLASVSVTVGALHSLESLSLESPVATASETSLTLRTTLPVRPATD
jgi:hypothetical protein